MATTSLHRADPPTTAASPAGTAAAARRRRRLRSARRAALLSAAGVVLFVPLFFPLVWMLSTSFKPAEETFQVPPTFFPAAPTLDSYLSQLGDSGFLAYLLNGALVAGAASAVGIAVAVLGGYAFSRLRFPGKRTLLLVVLASQMFPLVLIVVTLYVLLRQLQLLDTYLGLILAFTAFALPFSVWMMRRFFDTVPRELEEAAMIDGCGRLGAMRRVLLPLISPGVIAVGLYTFMFTWNNLLFSLTLISSKDKRTVPPGFLLTYVGEYQYFWADAMAGSVMATMPMVVVFIALQRFLVQGLSAGAVKG